MVVADSDRGAFLAYLLLYRFNKIVAEGVMVCIICPTATAAAVITSKLGGSAASLTTYTLLGNIGAAIAVPILFPLIEVNPDVSFWGAFWVILSKVFPLLICPFLAAWLLSKFLPKVHQKLLGYHELAFYLWAVSLAIVTAQTLYSLLNDPADGFTEIMIAVGALIACCLQFFLGRLSARSIMTASVAGRHWAEEYDSCYLDGAYLSEPVIVCCSRFVCPVAKYHQ